MAISKELKYYNDHKAEFSVRHDDGLIRADMLFYLPKQQGLHKTDLKTYHDIDYDMFMAGYIQSEDYTNDANGDANA